MSDLSLASQDPKRVMHSIIQRIATGPELSKNISREEAYLGMKAILDGQIDPIQIGIFFIALRMKRETADENLGVLDAILEATQRVTAAVDDVLDIADPYDGYSRCLPAAPFLAPLMAELGVPAVSHALQAVGPKYGVTARHVLRAAGVNVDLSPAAAAARLSDPGLGWTYIDQAQFCPKLHDLVGVRARMVKRQVITTVEVLAQPIVGQQRTHFVTGYVHKPYPPVYAMLARAAGFDSALIIRGVEGGVIPSLRQPGKVFAYHDRGEEVGRDIHPQDLGIASEVRAVPLPGMPPGKDTVDEIAAALDIPATAQAAADAGMAALGGTRGATYDSLVLSAALTLHHLGRAKSLAEAAEQARAALDTGRAAARVK